MKRIDGFQKFTHNVTFMAPPFIEGPGGAIGGARVS